MNSLPNKISTQLSAQLSAQLACFDEEALVALANRGLLRRAQKDLEKQSPTIQEQTADAITMEMGGHRIRFDARGPVAAQCSCPAAGVCHHILACTLGLQGMTSAQAADDTSTSVVSGTPASTLPEDPLAALHAMLLGFSASELQRHAGKPGYRWAAQFVLDLDPEAGLQIGGERHVVIRFLHPRMVFRYMGGGLESLVADVSLPQIEKYHVAAVLAFQRAHGLAITLPAPGARAGAAPDLGREHALSDSAGMTRHDSRARLRQSVRQWLEECVLLGLSHLSRGMQERATTLAVWAQGVHYYRLALLLRRLADHIELLLARAGSADEHQLFDEITFAFGLVCALDDAAARQLEPAHLVGRARSQYQETGQLALLGLGASAWRTASGYVGLTMLFWSCEDQVFLSCTDARPEQQRSFNPLARYRASGPWSGLGAPAQATGRRVVLVGAQINEAGRLAASESTRATVQAPGADFGQHLQPCKNWAELAKGRSINPRSLLAEPRPMKDWVVVQPARFGAAQFDATRQRLVWPLFDAQENRIDAELAYNAHNAHAILRIEQLLPQHMAPGSMLVARMARVGKGGAGLVLDPLSLVRCDGRPGDNPVDALHFDSAPQVGFVSNIPDQIKPLASAGPDMDDLAAAHLLHSLSTLRHGLQRQAERGLAADLAAQSLAQMASLAEKAAVAGLNAFSQLTHSDDDAADHVGNHAAPRLLQMNYLFLQYARMVENGIDEPFNVVA